MRLYLKASLRITSLIRFQDAEKLISELASDTLSLVKQDIGHNVTELQDAADIALARQSVKAPQGMMQCW